MIDYIKMLILALVAGATAALPTSSAAHYSVVNSIINFSEDEKLLGFYYSLISLAFALVMFVLFRKIYITGFKALFSKDESQLNYKKVIINVFVSLIPMALLFVPVGEGKLVSDYFDGFLTTGNLLLVALISVLGAFVLVISIWYTRQGNSSTKRVCDLRTAVRISVYQLISYVIPGVSRVSSAATNMLICDVDSKIVVREIYLYIAPQMFLVSIVKIIRFALGDTVIDPLMIIIALVAGAGMALLVVTKMSKVNIRRTFTFFSIYSAVFGITAAILSFVLR